MAFGSSAIFFGQLLLAIASASTVQITLLVNTSRVISATSSVSFGCVGIDWWPRTKCDYGRCSWDEASMLNLDLENVKLQKAVQAPADVVSIRCIPCMQLGRLLRSQPRSSLHIRPRRRFHVLRGRGRASYCGCFLWPACRNYS